jgi:hypothetical protein
MNNLIIMNKIKLNKTFKKIKRIKAKINKIIVNSKISIKFRMLII